MLKGIGSLLAVVAVCACAVTASAAGNGDYDGSGLVDAADFAEFPGCMTGPGQVAGLACEVFDFNADTDVDLGDVAAFQIAFGQLIPAPPGMVVVPAGEFAMGDSFGEGLANETPVHNVYLGTYFIDVNEVTNQQYADALNWAWDQGGLIQLSNGVVYQVGGAGQPLFETTSNSSGSSIDWVGNAFGVTAGREDHPVEWVTWYGAAAFCNWRSAMAGRNLCYDVASWVCDFDADGFRLPSEAEWEKAAGWDPDLATHVRFGEHSNGCGVNCLDGQRANYGSSGDPFDNGTTPVGYYDGTTHGSYTTQNARSYYGCRDMSGNLWEWCYDWHDGSYQQPSPYYGSSPYANPTGPATGTNRILRGGAWGSIPSSCRSAYRNWYTPADGRDGHGFRCVAGTP